MPKVRRKNVSRAAIEHLALRVRERAVPIEDLQNLAKWLDADPTVPMGRWFKRFDQLAVCRQCYSVDQFNPSLVGHRKRAADFCAPRGHFVGFGLVKVKLQERAGISVNGISGRHDFRRLKPWMPPRKWGLADAGDLLAPERSARFEPMSFVDPWGGELSEEELESPAPTAPSPVGGMIPIGSASFVTN